MERLATSLSYIAFNFKLNTMSIDLRKKSNITPPTIKELYEKNIDDTIHNNTDFDRLHEKHVENQRKSAEEANVKKAIENNLNMFS